MWGGYYNTALSPHKCDWKGGEFGEEFDACPDLKEYSDGLDCDPSCTLTGGSKSYKTDTCVWPNINNGGTPDVHPTLSKPTLY